MDVNKRFSPIMFTCMHCRTVIPVNIDYKFCTQCGKLIFPDGMDVITHQEMRSPGFKRTKTLPMGSQSWFSIDLIGSAECIEPLVPKSEEPITDKIEIITSGTQMRSVSDYWERLEAREQAKSLWRRFVEFWTGVDPASIPSVEVSSAESTDLDVPLAFSKFLWEESFLVSRNTDPGKHPFLFLWWAIPLAVAFLIILYWVFFTFAKAL